nr:tyrosine-type recombinase/integrase [Deinococcus sp. JMULE3]
MRHSTGTYLISRGEDPVSVAALLGHAQVSTTLNIYAHALPGKLRGLGYGLADLQGPQVRAGDAAQGGGPDGAGDGGDVPGEGKTRGAVSPVRRAVRKGGPRRKA